jgi:4'-phosphopantetheinyl transferase
MPLPPLADHDVHVWVISLGTDDKARRRELAHLARARLLAGYLDVRPAALELVRGPGGKPRLSGEPLRFNLSHSAALGLLGVSRSRELGVDVQAPHPATGKPWFARRICTPREYAAHLADPRPDALLRLWVRKEAVLKAGGAGSALRMGGIDVLEDQVAGGWLCSDLDLPGAPPGYRAALAVSTVLPDGVGRPVEVSTFSFSWE